MYLFSGTSPRHRCLGLQPADLATRQSHQPSQSQNQSQNQSRSPTRLLRLLTAKDRHRRLLFLARPQHPIRPCPRQVSKMTAAQPIVAELHLLHRPCQRRRHLYHLSRRLRRRNRHLRPRPIVIPVTDDKKPVIRLHDALLNTSQTQRPVVMPLSAAETQIYLLSLGHRFQSTYQKADRCPSHKLRLQSPFRPTPLALF